MNTKKVYIIAVSSALIGSAIFWTSCEASFLDRFFKKEQPQVLNNTLPEPTPVEVDPGVINLQDSFARVAERVKPAVVNISAVHITRIQQKDPYQFYFGDPNDFFERFYGRRRQAPPEPREYRQEGTGSGVIIDPDGYILTNNHVIQDADQLTVTLSDGSTHRGEVIGTDPRTDLAVIKIKSDNPLPYAPLGDSHIVRIGDWVLAVGSPFGLEQTVTAGIISAIRQSLNIEGKNFSNLFQTDAAINRGNSGGPLVNLKGQVIGINTAIYAPTGVFSGIGFAIPVNKVKTILSDLIEKGYVERSWMGVEITPIDDIIAQQFGLSSNDGVLINNVLPKSPADKAGLERGDIITEFNGQKIKDVNQLQDVVGGTPPDTKVDVKVVRDGKVKTVKLTTQVLPSKISGTEKPEEKPADNPEEISWLGAEFRDLDSALRDRLKVPEGINGIAVVKVEPSGFAAEAGIQEGDIIRSINRAKTPSVAILRKIKGDINTKNGVVFDVVRQGRSFYLSFKPLN